MCIVAIMSHGDETRLLTADGYHLDIQTELLEKFNTANCPSLEGKPKWFIIQACRLVYSRCWGLIIMRPCLLDRGFCKSLYRGLIEDRGTLITRRREQSATDDATPILDPDVNGQKLVPSYDDMLIIRPTVTGYKAFRDPIRGSWLIECICKVIPHSHCQQPTALVIQYTIILSTGISRRSAQTSPPRTL